jgi:IS605 OrfB family transposase
MIRRSSVSLKDCNTVKIDKLNTILKEYQRVVNLYIDLYWGEFNLKFSKDKVNTWLSARMQQNAGKNALQIIKSQRKKKNKTKPKFNKDVIDLDKRFVQLGYKSKGFDFWINLSSIGNKIQLKIPSKKHKHFNSLASIGEQKKSVRLRKVGKTWFCDVFFEIQDAKKAQSNSIVGVDLGIKKLITTSNSNFYGNRFEDILIKLNKKKKNSKNWKQYLHFKNTEINRLCKEMIRNEKPKILILEELKNISKNTKKNKRLNKSMRQKMAHWSYKAVFNKLEMLSESKGFRIIYVNPRYTSQTCSLCNNIDKKSRKRELYQCVACGYVNDADVNASINIRNRGVYSPSDKKINVKDICL